MFINANGTVQKRLRNVGGKNYKVANQALYSQQERSVVIYNLEIYRVYKIRLRVTMGEQVVSGYVRHVIVDGERYPMLFSYKNSKQGKPIQFPIAKIEASNGKKVLYQRAA